MNYLKSFNEANKALAAYIPLAHDITGKDITLGRMKPIMEALGNPHTALKIIHIAGTSGKTSTSYYIATLLHLAGKKVGLTVSPHMDSVAERVQINGEPLSESVFCSELSEFIGIIEKNDLEPTYFELLVAFAYWYFAKIKVDYAVIETGLGGLHDATNIANNADKLCVITDIGLDHTKILGETIPEIALQKAGIIHKGNEALMLQQSDEIIEVIEKWCKKNDANLKIIQDNTTDVLSASKLPAFQRRNWALAYGVYEQIKERHGLVVLDLQILKESLQIKVPGRMDEVTIGNKSIIMDGAHNEQKTKAFVSSFTQHYPDIKVPVLIAIRQGKDHYSVLELLKPITSKLFITSYDIAQDLPIPPFDVEELAKTAKDLGYNEIVSDSDRNKIYQEFLENIEDIGIITGSFFLISQLRANHKELINGQGS